MRVIVSPWWWLCVRACVYLCVWGGVNNLGGISARPSESVTVTNLSRSFGFPSSFVARAKPHCEKPMAWSTSCRTRGRYRCTSAYGSRPKSVDVASHAKTSQIGRPSRLSMAHEVPEPSTPWINGGRVTERMASASMLFSQ